MARIIYQPHCSECGAIIPNEIVYKKLVQDCGVNTLKRELTVIEPLRCSTCGNFFDCIEIEPPKEEYEYTGI